MPKLTKNQFYCVKCRKVTKPSSEPKLVKTKNDRHMLKGKCKQCDTTVCKFVSKEN